jgi:hypothetical protein
MVKIIAIIIPLALLFISCGAVPTTRYENISKDTTSNELRKEKDTSTERNTISMQIEDYDVSRFKTNLNETKKDVKNSIASNKEIWFSYPISSENVTTSKSEKVIGTSDGYRVLVFSTDDLEELDNVKSKLESLKNNNVVYTVFEPPFYNLYIGDFTILEDANSLRRKLQQFEFKEAKVVRTKINLFEK